VTQKDQKGIVTMTSSSAGLVYTAKYRRPYSSLGVKVLLPPPKRRLHLYNIYDIITATFTRCKNCILLLSSVCCSACTMGVTLYGAIHFVTRYSEWLWRLLLDIN